jgi:hypothetical protein
VNLQTSIRKLLGSNSFWWLCARESELLVAETRAAERIGEGVAEARLGKQRHDLARLLNSVGFNVARIFASLAIKQFVDRFLVLRVARLSWVSRMIRFLGDCESREQLGIARRTRPLALVAFH